RLVERCQIAWTIGGTGLKRAPGDDRRCLRLQIDLQNHVPAVVLSRRPRITDVEIATVACNIRRHHRLMRIRGYRIELDEGSHRRIVEWSAQNGSIQCRV